MNTEKKMLRYLEVNKDYSNLCNNKKAEFYGKIRKKFQRVKDSNSGRLSIYLSRNVLNVRQIYQQMIA